MSKRSIQKMSDEELLDAYDEIATEAGLAGAMRDALYMSSVMGITPRVAKARQRVREALRRWEYAALDEWEKVTLETKRRMRREGR